MTYRQNIARVFHMASKSDLLAGLTWYDDAHGLALSLTPDRVATGAGIIAALSPQKSWRINKRIAASSVESGTVRGNVGSQNAKGQAILDGGDPLEILRGDKERAFYLSILHNGRTDVVTIDRHAHDVAQFRVFSDAERKIGKVIYREMSAAYVDVAHDLGIHAAQLQAVTWVTWKNLKDGGLV